jgi:hypothetical protein
VSATRIGAVHESRQHGQEPSPVRRNQWQWLDLADLAFPMAYEDEIGRPKCSMVLDPRLMLSIVRTLDVTRSLDVLR